MEEVFYWFLWAILGVFALYGVMRLIFIAYFRTKWEFINRISTMVNRRTEGHGQE